MTRKEAIDYLLLIKMLFDNNYVHEALDIAIEALSADAVHNDSCGGCKHIGVIERCEQCRRIYAEFDDLYDKGGDTE